MKTPQVKHLRMANQVIRQLRKDVPLNFVHLGCALQELLSLWRDSRREVATGLGRRLGQDQRGLCQDELCRMAEFFMQARGAFFNGH